MRLLLATNNPHKAEEIASILRDLDDVEIVTPKELAERPPEPEEDGATLEANAYIKARELFDATGIPSIADDTGLEVESLGGAPGVYSARYSGEGATYESNCGKLLDELRATPVAGRDARFRTVICYVDPFRTLFAEGSVEGEIVEEPRGTGGFGYDPLFRPQGSDRTFAEMSAVEKNSMSHRGRALASFREMIAPYLEQTNGTRIAADSADCRG